MIGFGELIKRLLQNRGFGVQSPSAFFFVTQVLKERLPYYAYPAIDKAAQKGSHSPAHYRRLFRIANHLQPKNIIVAGDGTEAALCALSAAKPSAATHTAGDAAGLATLLQTPGHDTLLYIGKGCDTTQLLEAAIAHATPRSAIIMDCPHSTPQRAACWAQAIKNSATIVTYDLRSAGLLLFDNEKQKQNFTLLM